MDPTVLRRVTLLGGEPTRHPELAGVIQDLNGMNIKPVLDTNGIDSAQLFREITPDQLKAISFSLDGASPDSNDLIRGRGSFRSTTSSIKRARDLGFTVRLTFTVMGVNCRETLDLADLALEIGVQTLNLHLYCPITETNPAGFFVDPNRWVDTLRLMKEQHDSSPIEIVYRRGFSETSAPDDDECHVLREDRLQIYPNRTYGRCCLFSQRAELQGRLAPGSLDFMEPDREKAQCAPSECMAREGHPFGTRSPYFSARRRLTCISRKEFIGGLRHRAYSN
jgi:MoaA/NifB/PqqE/SkfB family radical SAM enzyme